MSLILFRLTHWFKYQLRAKNAHGLHSPFLYSFYQEVIQNPVLPSGKKLTQLKKSLRSNNAYIEFTDPRTKIKSKKRISDLAKSSFSTNKFGQFLIKLINWQSYTCILETGTSLGFNAISLSHSNAQRITTIEGSSSIAAFAKKLIQKNAVKDIEIIEGNIDDTIEQVVIDQKPDLIFLDADHRSEALFSHIEKILKYHSPSCIIIHDIYWSDDMYGAWNQLTLDDRFPLTVDIFEAGLIFPNQSMEKQHFYIRF